MKKVLRWLSWQNNNQMWHPFQIMPGHMVADEAVKTGAKPSPICRMVYRERVIRWFLHETNEDGYRLPNVDERTGITLRVKTMDLDTFELGVHHQKDLGVTHVLQGTMKVMRNDWRSPASWDFQQDFQASSGLRAFREKGEWEPGMARLVSRRNNGQSMVRNESVQSLTCLYSLLADFPTHLAFHPQSPETAVLEDVSVINQGASLQPVPRWVREHPMAKGLRGLVLDYPANFPVEFWVNEHGVVIYVCFGPNRVLFLETMEAIG